MEDLYQHPYPSPELEANYPYRDLLFQRLNPDEMHERATNFYQQMEQRRSVRMFSPDPVPRELIELAIMTASTAPSGAHKQPWRFVVVGDPARKSAIRQAAEEEERINYEENRMNEEWQRALASLGTDWHKEYLEIVPWIVVLFEERYEIRSDGRTRKNYYVKESTGIAAGLFVTALHNMGLATLPHTPSPMAFLTRTLERPENERPFVLFPVGYPMPGTNVPDLHRKPLEDVAVFFD
ncbi:MAG: nitroreductase family protein [Acidimicrobiia bacterium]|nr:nitroreductase family protein [Acidimicrobiia bacterium]